MGRHKKYDDPNKSCVGMVACAICGGETGKLVMDMKLRNRFDKYVKTGDVCDKCRKEYLTEGTLLIEPQSGDAMVIKDDAFKQVFNKPIPKLKIAMVEEGILGKLRR